jgi:hypothetical protein
MNKSGSRGVTCSAFSRMARASSKRSLTARIWAWRKRNSTEAGCWDIIIDNVQKCIHIKEVRIFVADHFFITLDGMPDMVLLLA